MLRKLLKAKIHRATVTEADLDYVGSLKIDQDLMDQAGIASHECILVADLDNGARLWTYAIPGARGSGTIGINGAAVHLVNKGDLVIIMCFGYFTDEQADGWQPRIVLVDEKNRPLRSP